MIASPMVIYSVYVCVYICLYNFFTSATCNFAYAKAKANGGVCEGHNSCNNGEPPHVTEILDLRKYDLRDSECYHVPVA